MDREDSAQPVGPAARRSFTVVGVSLGILALSLAATLWRWPADDAAASAGEGTPSRPSPPTLPQLFPKWPKPDLALVLSGEQHGYLQPCGCSHPQFGGLTRRYNFLEILKGGGWPVLALDLGDIPQKSGLQTMLKYTTSMKALDKMGYTAVTIGQYEMNLPLIDALANYALNNDSPRVLAANLRNKDKGQDYYGADKPMVESWKIAAGKVKVGIIASVGPSVTKKVTVPDVGFDAGPKVLPQMLKEIRAKKPDFLVLLYQGSLAEARACARAIPNFNVILCLSEGDEPPATPEQVGNTAIVTVGHKGRYVGVLGVYRTGKAQKPFETRYQFVSLGEEFETQAGKEKNHALMDLMENYAKEVRKQKFLAKAAKHQVQHNVQLVFPKSTYVGSEKCKRCHSFAYERWEKSPHASAYKTLEKAKNPSLRQYDSECISCHVTGWGYKGGFTDVVKTPLLRNNGCENCHGPCSEHIRAEEGKLKGVDKMKIRDVINPYRYDEDEKPEQRKKRLDLIDLSCQTCHDSENDVNWKIDKWWDRKIVHSDDTKKPAKKNN
jgi:Cytochrome c554 and c-prime